MENHDFFNRPQTLSKLFEIGQLIISELDSDRLFDVVVEQTNALIGTERCSIFLIDAEKQVLEPFASKDLRFGFKLEKDKGVAGWVYTHKKALTVNDAYGDPRFAKKADTASGFTTRNILCTPLISRKRRHN